MGKKYLVVNFKTYDESTGKEGLKLAKAIGKVSAGFPDVETIIVPTAFDLSAIAKKASGAKVFAQHAEPVSAGKNTGWITIDGAKKAGAAGLLINHAEHQLPREQIKKLIELCKAKGLTSIVCAKDSEDARAIAAFDPDFVSVEPPELIGSGISVSSAKPEAVTSSVSAVKSVSPKPIVLCGAGISSGSDVKKAIELGAEGVLLASYITLAKRPKKAIQNILSGFF